MSYKPTIRRMDIHRSAMGHVIGRNGMTVKQIQQDYGVLTYNTKFGDEEDGYITFYVKGQANNVNMAVKKIQSIIEISNQWCKENNHKYF